MKTITVKVTSTNEKDNSDTPVLVEKDRGAGYVRLDSRDIVTNKDKEQTFELNEGERLVIEAYPPAAVDYDREQGAAFKVAEQANPSKIDSPRDAKPSEAEKKELAAQAAPKSGSPQAYAASQNARQTTDAQGRVQTVPQGSQASVDARGPANPNPNPGLVGSKDKK